MSESPKNNTEEHENGHNEETCNAPVESPRREEVHVSHENPTKVASPEKTRVEPHHEAEHYAPTSHEEILLHAENTVIHNCHHNAHNHGETIEIYVTVPVTEVEHTASPCKKIESPHKHHESEKTHEPVVELMVLDEANEVNTEHVAPEVEAEEPFCNEKTPTKSASTKKEKTTTEKKEKASTAKKTKAVLETPTKEVETHESPKKSEQKSVKRSVSEKKVKKDVEPPKEARPSRKDRSVSKDDLAKYENMLNTKKSRAKK